MSELGYKSILPFIPGGRDYSASRRFFGELGFAELWEHDGLTRFQSDRCGFFLQDFHDDAFASNLMMKLVVADLDAWWLWIESKHLDLQFAGVRLKPPTKFPWGREVNIIDMAGVCWHISDE